MPSSPTVTTPNRSICPPCAPVAQVKFCNYERIDRAEAHGAVKGVIAMPQALQAAPHGR